MICCDDGTMPDNDPVKEVYELLDLAFQKFDMDMRLAEKLEPLLQAAGFVNISCVVKKTPVGVWARDKTLRLIGMYHKIAMLDLLPTFAGRPFMALGLTPEEAHVRVALARKALGDANVHRYANYYFWIAQKPE